MSSGLPPILAAPSAQQFSNPFSHFGYLFGQPPPPPPQSQLPTQPSPQQQQQQQAASINRFKVKRHRQRVDAGEPRNTYQGGGSGVQKAKIDGMMQMHIDAIATWNNAAKKEISAMCDETSTTTTTQERLTPLEETTATTTTNEFDSSSSAVEAGADEDNTQEIEEEHERDHGENERQDEADAEEEEEEQEDEEEDGKAAESPGSSSIASTCSAALKRKSFQPQKIEEQLGIETSNEPEQINVSIAACDESEETDEKQNHQNPQQQQVSALRQQLATTTTNPATAAQNIFETQKRIYAAFVEQQRRNFEQQQQQQQQDRKINYEPLVQNLKNELFDNITQAIEKIVKDWAVNELSRLEASMASGVGANAPPHPHPTPFHPMFPLAAAANHNPLAAFHVHNPPHPVGGGNGGGIFPPNLNPFTQLQVFNNALRRNFVDEESGAPKKKRIKLTETKLDATRTATPQSPPATPPGHVTPLNRYFPPTMVGHPFYNGMSFGAANGAGGDREDSPTISDEMSDCLGYEGGGCGGGVNATLTPMHLRKAKLMFFYTRYPNSNLLKTYFPDIRFNKNNTAQLVKWFSNFREFYYIQMEKFARQLLAEGVQTRDDIFVSKDSELFKILNTHYNRNNHIKPPDRLVEVVQETLREFFDAVKLGKDVEPSWKKTIYKIINRMDDPIPDFFKEPNFLELLES